MIIDMYTHIVPKRYKEALAKKAPQLEIHLSRVPTLYDMEHRFRIMDKYKDVRQILTLPPTAALILERPESAIDFARLANDEMAEIVTRYPDRFAAGVASLPMTDMDAAIKELDRAIHELKLKGLQLLATINNEPLDLRELMPLFERMSHYNLPIWIHPAWPVGRDDYRKYFMDIIFGWPYESTVAMSRLVLDGLFEQLPGMKIIVHHCGALVPFFAARMSSIHSASNTMQGMSNKPQLKIPILDSFKKFYADTALNGNTAGLMCGYSFYGADHLIFGSDMPYDNTFGEQNTLETIRSIELMAIGDAEKRMIYAGNAERLLGL